MIKNSFVVEVNFNFKIPHETITFGERDLSWINSQVKHLISENML